MNLEIALKGMLDAEQALRSAEAIGNPFTLSNQMMRLSTYVSAVEIHLAEHERDFELISAKELKERMRDQGMKVTQAEREVDIETAELKGQIKYLTRLVKSAWSQVGVIQSRINHLGKEAETNQ